MSLPFELKTGVDPRDVHPLMWVYVHHIGLAHLKATGQRMTVTSLSRREGASYHSPDYARTRKGLDRPRSLAFDMRRWHFPEFERLEEFCLKLKRELDVGCLIEPEWMTPQQVARRGGLDKIAPHVHWQVGASNLIWLSTEGELLPL